MRQQSSRASPALDQRSHFARAPAAPSDSCPWAERLLKQYHNALAPGRRARSREGHTKRGRRLTTQARSTGRRRSWRCLRAPVALSLHAAPAAHQSGHARLHPDAISAAPRSPPPPLSCERRGAPPSSRASWPCPPVTRRGDGGTWALRAMNPLIRTPPGFPSESVNQ